MMVFILLSMQYFRELYSMSIQAGSGYSLSFLFVLGEPDSTTLIIFQSSQVGLGLSLRLVSSEAIGIALIVFMFSGNSTSRWGLEAYPKNRGFSQSVV